MYALEGTLTTREARYIVQATEKGKKGKSIMERIAKGHHSREFPEKHDIDSTEAFFTACEKLHVINTPNFGNLETVPPRNGITSIFSFGTGLSDQEWHNITVTTSLLSASSPYQLLPVNRNGRPLEGKELRMVALKDVRGHRESTSSSGIAAARYV
jgi:hypothetical protein